MLNKKFVEGLKRDHQEYENERRQIISLSNIVLHNSKKVIFSLHRKDIKIAEQQIKEIEIILKDLEKKFGLARLDQEGSYKAGAEEYIEAKTFYLILSGKKLDKIKEVNLSFDSYLGGICDLTGELVRQAVNEAARGNLKEVGQIYIIIEDIMSELVDFDITGYLRTKYDQAKNNLRKIEQINYEIKMRK